MAAVVALVALAFVPEGNLADRVALASLFALGLATACGWLQLIFQGRVPDEVHYPERRRESSVWMLVTLATAVLAGVSVQTWIRPGSTIAGGDVVVPDGTAWIPRLFEAWTWGGSTLGEPSQLPLELPWAAVLGVVHAAGGDAGTAQRIWYTVLFVAAGLGGLGLLASLGMGPFASLAGAAVYLLNPYVITWVNTNDPYMAALFLLPTIPAALVAAGTGRLSSRSSAIFIAGTAPLLGYTFLDPPLVGMILAVVLATPLVVAWLDGRKAATRTLRAFLLAIPMLAAVSAYWAIPAFLHLAGAIPTQFTALSGWTWVEARANIRNALWLNTHWGWSFQEYFPYAREYDRFPLSLARFALPAIAFAGLGLAAITDSGRPRRLRLAVMATTVAVFMIAFSTGTNPPGNAVFVPLYNLPFGWLLREPGRFLMLAALAYAVLVAIAVEESVKHKSVGNLLSSFRFTPPAIRFGLAPIALATSFLVGFPVYTAVFVPDTKPTLAPWAVSSRPTHVQMPSYWPEMAAFADSLPIQGAVLVMPPDDWYEMPYTWYYGTDAFITQLFRRRVLVPSTQTYTPASNELSAAVNLTGQSILKRDWRQVGTLVNALNSPLMLVRKDIEAPFANHSILFPGDLATALEGAPNFVLMRQVGPLELFAFHDPSTETEVNVNFATINTRSPDLRILALFSSPTGLVTSGPRLGTTNVVQAPSVDLWQSNGSSLVWRASTRPGWRYQIAELSSGTLVHLSLAGTFVAGPSGAQIEYAPDASSGQISASVTARPAITNGDFAGGPWHSVSNCASFGPEPASPDLSATVVNTAPGGQPALRLSGTAGSACQKRLLDWRGGPIVISLLAHRVHGAAPRLCVWEDGPNRCASLPSINSNVGWSQYTASVVPDTDSTALTLYLYADTEGVGNQTVAEYADIRVLELVSLPSIAVVEDPYPKVRSPVQLAVVHNTYSNDWTGSTAGEHVLVDGLLNGWLVPTGTQAFAARYDREALFRAAGWISVIALALLALVAVWPLIGIVVARRDKGN